MNCFQMWFAPVLESMGTNYITYMGELNKLASDKTTVDGIQIVLIAQMLGQNITIVCPETVWCSDTSMKQDIVLCYSGVPNHQFFPTHVGNY